MKRAVLESNPEVAQMASGLQQATRGTRPRRRHRLLERLAAAARLDDRPEFDRIFDLSFERVYAIAWRVTGDRARAEAITAYVLSEAVVHGA
jgi:hypothetical protein